MGKKVKQKSNVKSVSVKNKNVPISVKVISIIEYFLAAILIIAAIASFYYYINPEKISSMPTDLQASLEFQGITAQTFASMALTSILLGAIFIIISINLWKLKNWSRIAHLILYAYIGITSLIGLLQGYFGEAIFVILSVVVIIYLGFNKKVVSSF
ncbi:MAG: hypothetical protein ACOYT4_02310 [Nanoarchaeota archaeon]